MLPVKQPGEPDYRKRFDVLQQAGIVTRPIVKANVPLTIPKRDVLDELSFGFFVAWVLKGVLNEKVSISFVALPPHGKTVLVAHGQDGRFATPSPRKVVDVDTAYLKCPIDDLVAPNMPDKTAQVLCPVLNRIRYNLGTDNVVAHYQIPRKSEECCASRKNALWDYLGGTLLADPEHYGRMFGGVAFPIAVAPDLMAKYATGLEPERGDFGKIIDETLLWYAMEASGCMLGMPNCSFPAPFESHEIDFLLYDAAGKKRTTREPDDGWEAFIFDQSLCIFETTVGHQTEGESKGAAPGRDHPKNKLVNFLSLAHVGFKCVDFLYLTITGFGKHLSPTLERALKGTRGFTYWSLCDAFPGADLQIMNQLDDPVPLGTWRQWHQSLVETVRTTALAWAQK